MHLIDSTGLRLSDLSADWARFSDGVCGAKLHIVYDCDAERPIDAAITPARLNDITAAQALPIAAGATYVFDLGYYDFAWWARLDDAGCRIVTRFKSNTRLTVVAENPVSEDGPILSDRIGYLAASRTNPFQAPVREIRVRIESGKILRILSNDIDATADEIATLYKRRWQIGVSNEGHAVMSVKVRPEPKDSGSEAREAPWRESKTAEPSDNILERSMREASGCNVQ